jgi:hypothetical protein
VARAHQGTSLSSSYNAVGILDGDAAAEINIGGTDHDVDGRETAIAAINHGIPSYGKGASPTARVAATDHQVATATCSRNGSASTHRDHRTSTDGYISTCAATHSGSKLLLSWPILQSCNCSPVPAQALDMTAKRWKLFRSLPKPQDALSGAGHGAFTSRSDDSELDWAQHRIQSAALRIHDTRTGDTQRAKCSHDINSEQVMISNTMRTSLRPMTRGGASSTLCLQVFRQGCGYGVVARHALILGMHDDVHVINLNSRARTKVVQP